MENEYAEVMRELDHVHRVELGGDGISSSQIGALVLLLVQKGVLKPEFPEGRQ